MSNGTIGFGGVANEASVSSFLGTYFNPDGSVTYMPEQIPPQGWYRRGFAMNLAEGIDGIFHTVNIDCRMLLTQFIRNHHFILRGRTPPRGPSTLRSQYRVTKLHWCIRPFHVRWFRQLRRHNSQRRCLCHRTGHLRRLHLRIQQHPQHWGRSAQHA